jgi:type II secretory pathway component GspD/PulD (secretin)
MLFSYNKQDRTKSELVIMLTPFILNVKNVDEIRIEHEKRMREMGGSFHLINNLGSLVTEKSSRDWMMQTNKTLIPSGTQPFEQSDKENRVPVTPVKP